RRVRGEAVASQLTAIANGLAAQYAKLKEVGIDKTAEQLLMMTQYFDTMQNVAQEGRSNVLFMPSNPGGQGEIGQEIRNALFAVNAAEDGATLSAPESRYTSSHRSDGGDVPPQPTTPPSSGESEQPNAQSLKSKARSIAQQWTNPQQPPQDPQQ